jgi:hypothetical protein
MKKNLIGILLTLFCLTACYTTRVHINKNASPVPQMKYDGSAFNFGSKHHNLVFGLIEFSEPVALHELCPDGVAYTEHAMSFIDLVVSGILQSFYNPLTVSVYCDGGSSAEAILNDDGDVVAYMPLEEAQN